MEYSEVVRWVLITLLLLLPTCPTCRAGQQDEEQSASKPDFFSGVVMALSADSITVNRKGLGRESETKTFLVDANTRVEGKLRVKAKVTIRFAPGETGERAVRIIVR